jgi:hypothetical protein
MDEVVRVWEDYFKTISNWKVLIEGIEPKDGGCGLSMNCQIQLIDRTRALLSQI